MRFIEFALEVATLELCWAEGLMCQCLGCDALPGHASYPNATRPTWR